MTETLETLRITRRFDAASERVFDALATTLET